LAELNDVSRKCVDRNGNQLFFLIYKGSDRVQLIWKATIKITCVSFNTNTKKVTQVRVINLKQFLHIFKLFSTNIEALQTLEQKSFPLILDQLDDKLNSSDDTEECIICLDKKPDNILSCLHSFCNECILKWLKENNSCPICCETTDDVDSWEKIDIPDTGEINEEIFIQIQKIIQQN
jgi:Zinc finger, C3HC4 type (RING finger)